MSSPGRPATTTSAPTGGSKPPTTAMSCAPSVWAAKRLTPWSMPTAKPSDSKPTADSFGTKAPKWMPMRGTSNDREPQATTWCTLPTAARSTTARLTPSRKERTAPIVWSMLQERSPSMATATSDSACFVLHSHAVCKSMTCLVWPPTPRACSVSGSSTTKPASR